MASSDETAQDLQFALLVAVERQVFDTLLEDRQAMVVAQYVSEGFEFLSRSFHLFRPNPAQEPLLVPQILRAFAPFVQTLRGRRVESEHISPLSAAIAGF